MKRLAIILLSLFATVAAISAQTHTISLWNGNPPSDNGLRGEETYNGTYYANVTEAYLYVYMPEKPNGLAVLACPGGSYNTLWLNHEMGDLAEWFTSRGIIYAALKYRLPNGHPEIPMEDVRRAMRILRDHQEEWGYKSLGVMGRSAGGHLAASAATMFTEDWDRPDFQMLFYPVITCDPSFAHMDSVNNLLGRGHSAETAEKYSLEKHVPRRAPQAFIAHSSNDFMVKAANSINYYNALVANGVSVTMHIYPTGGHGWNLDSKFQYSDECSAEMAKWLEELARKL